MSDITPSNIWECPNCEGNPTFDHKAMMDHIFTVHFVDVKAFNGTRELILHADGSKHFVNAYEWTIQGLKFKQTIVSLRTNVRSA